MCQQLRGQKNDPAALDTDQLVGRQLHERAVDGHPRDADRLGQPLLTARKVDSRAMVGSGAYEPGGDTTGRVTEAGADPFVLLVTYLTGQLDQHMAAYGWNIPQQGQNVVPRNEAQSSPAARTPGRRVTACVQHRDLVDGAGGSEVTHPESPAPGVVVLREQSAGLHHDQVLRPLAP